MAFINDEVFDQGLDYADTNGTRLDITSTDPGGTYATMYRLPPMAPPTDVG